MADQQSAAGNEKWENKTTRMKAKDWNRIASTWLTRKSKEKSCEREGKEEI